MINMGVNKTQEKNNVKLSPERIFSLFYKYKLSYIPVVKQQKIQGFISREKTRVQANKVAFFESRIEVNLKYIFQTIDAKVFFSELDNLGLSVVPFVDSENFLIKSLSCSDFNSIFRPVQELSGEEFLSLITEYNLPVFILNSHFDSIYVNKQGKLFLKNSDTGAGKKGKNIMNVIPADFLKKFEEADRDKIYKLYKGSKEHHLRIFNINFKRGRIWVITVIK
ncbi:MAG TPA: hypothetical protein VKS21_08085 [Spirochaetota bacterium]|nr:hypothetical protein [Spirochaetota bacterium]